MENEFNHQAEPVENKTEQTELATCQGQLEEVKTRLMRATADFDNYKKRLEKERGQWAHAAQATVLGDLLLIVSDFDRALSESQKQATTPEMQKFLAGFELIKKALYKFLHKYEVEEITDFTVFNPEKHEALMTVEAADHNSGEVVAVLEKGFTFRGNVLRPAKVSVAQ